MKILIKNADLLCEANEMATVGGGVLGRGGCQFSSYKFLTIWEHSRL